MIKRTSTGDEIQQILLVNCVPSIQDTLTQRLEGEPTTYQLLTSVASESTFELLVSGDIFLLVVTFAENGEFSYPFLKKIILGYPHLNIVLIVPFVKEVDRSKIPEHSNLHFIEKIAALSGLVNLVKELNSQDNNQGFTGTLKITRLEDLIQMCCLSGATITIQVNNEQFQGSIYILNGNIVHAECDNISGEEAFYTIMTWHNGGFKTFDGNFDINFTIEMNYQYLLLESARRSDEANRIFDTGNETVEINDVVFAEPEKLRVLIVEDSTIMAKIMSSMLLVAGDIEIAGVANNGQEALQMMDILQFDLILLDVNMPVMSGRMAIKHIMIKSPRPVVVMSNVGSRSGETIISLLDLGAVDFISKPVRGEDPLLQQQKITERVRKTASAKTEVFRRFRNPRVAPSSFQSKLQNSDFADHLVVVSTGCSGYGALYHLVSGIPERDGLAFICLNFLPVVFLGALADRLTKLTHQKVTPIKDGTPLQSGQIYLDAQKRSLRLQESQDTLLLRSQNGCCNLENGPGCFDLFLFSVADFFQKKLLVVLLSGAEIGNLEGLRYVREKGGCVFSQAPATCMIPDPLIAIIKEKLTDKELEPEHIASQVLNWAK